MSVLNINKNDFQSVVLDSKEPVVVDFWASWCGPCRMFLPIVEEFAQENPHVKVGKVNVDEQSDLAKQFRIMTAKPTKPTVPTPMCPTKTLPRMHPMRPISASKSSLANRQMIL